MEPEGVGRCRRYQRAPPSGPPPAASPDVKDICRENTRRPLVTNLEGARVGGLLWPTHSRRESPALRPAPCSQPSCHSKWRTRPKRAIKIGAMVTGLSLVLPSGLPLVATSAATRGPPTRTREDGAQVGGTLESGP